MLHRNQIDVSTNDSLKSQPVLEDRDIHNQSPGTATGVYNRSLFINDADVLV